MRSHIFVAIRMTLALLFITCGLYPAVVWAVAQTAFPHQANGSLVRAGGRIVGSEIIGQKFEGVRYFHGRPSAADYDGAATGGTNLGPTSKKLRDSIADRVANRGGAAPADAVTSSASGVDTHISPENALQQVPRVAQARHLDRSRVRALVERRTEKRFLGVFGEPRVNVLLLNLDLDRGVF